MQSTWLDETINAVVAGLNTSVYIRNFTPRIPSSRRRRTGKRRKVKKTSSAKGMKGKASSTGVKRRRRKVRRTKSKKKLMKRSATARNRIANNLGIVKDKKSSSLPTVYRPSEHTLSNMRADIGAASLSIYGDPFDLDPFVDRSEEDQQQAHVTSLLEAKRRGISRSALRSHQPVARPVTGGLSRRGLDVPQSGGVVEAAPVPDLLGSILTGQNMLLMDSSDVVINRDGSLKASKPTMPTALKPGCIKSSSSDDASTHVNPVMSPDQGDMSPSLHYNGDLPGFSHSSSSRPFSQSSFRLPPYTAPSASRIHSDLPPRGHPSLQLPRPIRPNHPPGHCGKNGGAAPSPSSSIHPTLDSSSKSRGIAPSQSQPKKEPLKPMWMDVSVLPRIPKIKRESCDVTNDGTSQGGSSSSRENSNSNSTPSSNGYGMPESGMNSLAGDKGRQQSVDQQKGRTEGQSQRQREDGASSSSAFSNSFSSSSSSSAGFPASQPHYSSSASSAASSSVSFRINSSGNSWHSRRLSMGSSSAGGGNMQEERWSKKEDEVRKRRLHRDKQMLLASRMTVSKEQDSNNIYDPFNPTLSDSSSSEDEAKSTSPDYSVRKTTHEGKTPSFANKNCLEQNKQNRVHVKTEVQEIQVSQEEARGASSHENISKEVTRSVLVKTEKDSRLLDTKTGKKTALLDIKIKKEPGLDDEGETETFGHNVKTLNSGTADSTQALHLRLDLLKTERDTVKKDGQQSAEPPNRAPLNCKNDSSSSSSAPTKRKQKAEIKPDSESCSKSPSKDSVHKKKPSHISKEQCSSSSETDRGRRGDHHAPSKGGQQTDKEKNRERSTRWSRSRERRRARSTSESCQSNSPERTRRKRSRSKDRRRSRSASSSSSREHSRRKKHKQITKERNDGRERDSERGQLSKDRKRGRSRSKSLSKSRSRSRSKDHKRRRSHSKSHSKSRSRSRERRKDHTRLQQTSNSSRDKADTRFKDKRRRRSRSSSRETRKDKGSSSKSSQKTSESCVLSSKDTKLLQDKKKEKDITRSSIKEEKVVPVNKQETPSCTAACRVKKEGKNLRTDCQATTAEMLKEMKAGKEIKKENQPSLDMFEDTLITKAIKKETTDIHALMEVKDKDQERKEDPIKTETCEIIKTETCEIIKTETCDIIKTETCEIPIIKSEPRSPELSHLPPVTSFSTLTTPATADSLQDKVQSHPVASVDQVQVKQEVQQPSDSDDDFNVDVMLDNLDYVKSEPAEGSGASVKEEKDAQEGKNEGEQLTTVAGAKSKTQVKRVTWNIQEPEGPQPEKSASKLALYKLRLKQEGARKPSSTSQTNSQDITGTVCDPFKKGAVGPSSSTSRSGGIHPERLPSSGQGQAEEGDMLSKDKQYLKKLHMQERAIEEVKLAIKPFYQRRDINKDEYKEILRKAVQKVCHSKSGEINPVKVGNLVKAYVDKYKHARKHKKEEDSGRAPEGQTEVLKTSASP